VVCLREIRSRWQTRKGRNKKRQIKSYEWF